MDHAQRLEGQIKQLADRVDRLEKIHGLTPHKKAPPTPSAPDVEPPKAPETKPPAAPSFTAKERAAALQRSQEKLAPTRPRPTHSRPAGPARIGNIEQVVGVKVFAVAGALIVIAGAAFFFKLAWDQGWLGRIPDVWKAMLGLALGVSLLVSGDGVRRRFGSLAGTGLNAAGVGVLYATTYASFRPLDLLNRPTAFALLAVVSTIAFVIAARSRSVAVACIAMIGAYAAPFLLSTGEPPPLGLLPAYWMTLTITGAALAASFGATFGAARGIGWWGTLLLGVGWALWRGPGHPFVGAAFFAAFWIVTHAELIIRAYRQEKLGAEAHPLAGAASWKQLRGVKTSLSATAWAVGLGAVSLSASRVAHLDWMAPAAGFAVTAHLALVLVGSLRVLRDTPRTELERLGATFAASAGALGALTIALAFADWTQAASWFALAFAAGAAARWIRAGSLMVYAIIVALLGTGRMALLQWWEMAPIISFEGVILTRGSMLVIAGAAVWLALAALGRFGKLDGRAGPRDFCVGAGLVMLFAAPVHETSTWAGLTAVWSAIAVAVWLTGLALRTTPLHRFAFVGSLAAMGAWLGAESQSQWLANQSAVVLNAPLALALLIAALGFAIAFTEWRRRRPLDSLVLPSVMIAIPAIWSFGVTTFEVIRIAERVFSDPTAQRAIVSLWWAALALGLVVCGAAIGNSIARRVGLVVLAVAGAKTALYDLIGVGAAWRVATFLFVGAVMLIVAVFYARASRAASQRNEEQP